MAGRGGSAAGDDGDGDGGGDADVAAATAADADQTPFVLPCTVTEPRHIHSLPDAQRDSQRAAGQGSGSHDTHFIEEEDEGRRDHVSHLRTHTLQ